VRANLIDQAMEERDTINYQRDRQFLNGLIIGVSLQSDDNTTNMRANKKLSDILNDYDPENVQ
jgi:predicted membrane GTPase involved in stress response